MLETRSFTESSKSPSDVSAMDISAEAELQHENPPQTQSEREQASLTGPESVERASVATEAPERVKCAPPPSPPDQNTQAQGLALQAHQVSVGCEAVLTPTISTQPPTSITQLNGSLLDPQLEDRLAPTFRCHYEDISGNLNERKFVLFSSDPRVRGKGYFKLVVEGLPPLNVEETSFHQPGKDYYTNFSGQPDSRGYVNVTREPNQKIKFPSFPLSKSRRESWSQQSLKEFWEGTLKEPLRDMLYVIGDPLFPDVELSPGEGLKRIDGYKNLRGIGTTYIYLSFGMSFSVMHGEDAKFRSMNLLRSGEHKLWLVVEPAYEEEPERYIRQEFPRMTDCSQALRHLSCNISPSNLDKWNIPSSLDYCKPGEAIVTEPGAFHPVLNIGANYTIPNGYKFCQKSCEPHPITAAHLRLCEKGVHWPRFKQTKGRVCREIKTQPCHQILSRRKGRQFRPSLSQGCP
jgi:hypothetical protein